MLQVKTGGSTVGIGFSENLIRVRGTANLTLSAGVASLTLGTGATGFFMFERKLIRVNGVDDTQVIQLSFEDISTSLTVGSGSDGIKIAASNIDGAFLITAAGVAGKVTVGTLTLTDAAGELPIWLTSFEFSNLKLELNTTGAGVSATIGSTSFDYTAPLRHNFIAVSGEFSIGLSFGGLALTLNTTPTTGRVSFEKSSITVNNTPVDVFKVGLLHVNTSLTVGAGANGVKIAIDDISGAFLMKGAGVAGKLTIGSLTLTDADGNTRPDISLVALRLPARDQHDGRRGERDDRRCRLRLLDPRQVHLPVRRRDRRPDDHRRPGQREGQRDVRLREDDGHDRRDADLRDQGLREGREHEPHDR